VRPFAPICPNFLLLGSAIKHLIKNPVGKIMLR
jgi:hypothetical protein